MSYLDVRRRVRDSLKHVYLADRPKGAQCPMGPERGRERRLSDKETCIIIVSLQIYDFVLILCSFHDNHETNVTIQAPLVVTQTLIHLT